MTETTVRWRQTDRVFRNSILVEENTPWSMPSVPSWSFVVDWPTVCAVDQQYHDKVQATRDFGPRCDNICLLQHRTSVGLFQALVPQCADFGDHKALQVVPLGVAVGSEIHSWEGLAGHLGIASPRSMLVLPSLPDFLWSQHGEYPSLYE